jgi:hypothetical protein
MRIWRRKSFVSTYNKGRIQRLRVSLGLGVSVYTPFAAQVAEADDGVRRVLDELLSRVVADVPLVSTTPMKHIQ